MIQIGKPYITYEGEKTRLCAEVTISGEMTVAWFSVDREYGGYLTADRADAFVAAFLTTAMRQGEDIYSEAPVTERLKYQLNHYLIPTVAANTKVFHPMKIHGGSAAPIRENAGAVAIGWTAGVDCFYSFMKNQEAEEPSYRITHLLVADIGTYEGEHMEYGQQELMVRARGMADDFGLKTIGISSNIHLIAQEVYISVSGYRMSAAVLALQGLIRVFLHSSSIPLEAFEISDNACHRYEGWLFPNMATDCTSIYSPSSQASRVQRIQALAEYPPAWTRLHPCIEPRGGNCGKCMKCIQAFATIEAAGKLDRFREVLDVDDFRKNWDHHLLQLARHQHMRSWKDTFELLKAKGMVPPRITQLERIYRAVNNSGEFTMVYKE